MTLTSGAIAGIAVGGVIAAAFLAHLLLTWRDSRKLSALRQHPAMSLVRTRAGYDLAVRFTKATGREGSRLMPVFIANGLGATLATIGAIHDALVAAGFTVLSYDRVGVGLSDANPHGRTPTVDECLADMLDVMNWAPGFARTQRWLLVGPSMGSVVVQAFAVRHPDRVGGFLNMDGFPAPFGAGRADKFASASRMYSVMAFMSRIGVMRLMLSCAGSFFARFQSGIFTTAIIRAQMTRPGFYTNTGREMNLMTALARASAEGWGALDLVSAPPELVRDLERAPPTRNGSLKDGEWFELPRSKSDTAAGPSWLPPAELEPLVEQVRSLAARPDCPLGRLFASIPVRVMSARSYEYVGGDSFYDAQMKTWAAAEHAMHAIVARDGARYIWPVVGHDKIFLEAPAIAMCCAEIDSAARGGGVAGASAGGM